MQQLIINGWTIYAHSCFLESLEVSIAKVASLREKYPETYQNKQATKHLAAIVRLAFDVIPQDPTRSEYRQGSTLGNEYRHWFRAKFFQQYRLFFRYQESSKIIVYGWVNDDRSKRAYGSSTDAYRVFGKMLDNGNPPDDWDTLLKGAKGDLPEVLKEYRSDNVQLRSIDESELDES